MTAVHRAVAPQAGDPVELVACAQNSAHGKVEKVLAYWVPEDRWEVEIIDDHGRRSDGKGNSLVRFIRWVRANDRGGSWQEVAK